VANFHQTQTFSTTKMNASLEKLEVQKMQRKLSSHWRFQNKRCSILPWIFKRKPNRLSIVWSLNLKESHLWKSPNSWLAKGSAALSSKSEFFLDLLCALSTSELSYARNLLCFSNFNGFSILVRRGNVVLLYFLFQYCTPKLIIVLCFFVVFTHLHLLFSLSHSLHEKYEYVL